MPVVKESIVIAAPLERCFALSTSVDLVKKTLGMKLVGGVMTGHIVMGSRVIWRGWKFGLPTSHHTLITGYTEPHADGDAKHAFFQDTQERGRFASFHHDHFFTERDGKTTLEDAVYFELPFGWAGRLVAKHVMAPYVQKLARTRFAMLKRMAESDEWREFVHLKD